MYALDKQYWHQRWQSDEIGFNQPQPNILMQRYFPELELNTGARVFVPLCGKSVDMIWLAGQGYKVIGVELSQPACQDFFYENKIHHKVIERDGFVKYESNEITLFAGDFFKFDTTLLGECNAVYDRAALIALPDQLRQRYAAHLSKLLAPSTKILLITSSYDQNEMQGPPFSVNQDEVKSLFKNACKIKQVYGKEVKEIPQHLKDKGLTRAIEQVYTLMKEN